MTALETKNEFIAFMHVKRIEYVKQFGRWNVKLKKNLTDAILERTFEFEERFQECGENSFYNTITGTIWTEGCKLVVEENLFDLKPKASFFQSIKQRIALPSYVDDYNCLYQLIDSCDISCFDKVFSGWGKIVLENEMAFLPVEVIDEFLFQFYMELIVLGDIPFADSTFDLFLNRMGFSPDTKEKVLGKKREF